MNAIARDISEISRYRALVGALVMRHLASRYRGSALGFLWSLLNPLSLMFVYWLVFKFYIRFDQVTNYPVFLFCGLLPWLWSTSSLQEGTSSIVASGHLITKSMFPPILLPLVAVLTNLIHLLLALPLLFVFMVLTGWNVSWTVILLPALLVLHFLFLFGAVLIFSAWNVRYRDVQHIVANVLTFLFFLSPIIYPIASVPEQFRFTLYANPFGLFTLLYHDILFDGVVPQMGRILSAAGFAVVALAIGMRVHHRHRETFAELL